MHRSPHRRFTAVSFCILIAILFSACGTPQPVGGPTPTSSPSLSPSATSTLAPSATPTPSPTPTNTPEPTETPAGFYRSDTNGFSFVAPTTWKLQDAQAGSVVMADENGGLFFFAWSSIEDEPLDFEGALEQFIENELSDATVSQEGEGQVELAGGQQADYADLLMDSGAAPTALRFIYTAQGKRVYTFVLIANPNSFETRQKTITRLFESLSLYTPQPYGLSRDETLTLLGYEPDLEDIDPALATSSADDYSGYLFSGLVTLTPQMQVAPDLAEKWQVSPDGLVYTFTLRSDTAFSSGKAIEAADVKASWERACDPETGSTSASSYLGDISGVAERLSGEADEISGVKVIDERTLEVRLVSPRPYFLAKLTYPVTFVYNTLEPELHPEDWALSPDASGPYQVKEMLEGEAWIFERNPNYFNQPAIPYVVYRFYPGGSAISLYEEGSIDILTLDAETKLRVRQEDDPLHGELHTTPSMCNNIVMLNNQKAPLDDPLVRQALSLAIDRQALIDKLTQGTAIESRSILPPAIPGFSPDNQSPAYDPEAARAAWQASKYAANPPPIVISAGGLGDGDREDISLLVGMWREVLGIEVQVEYVDPSNLTEAIRERGNQMALYGWCADYPDPENFLSFLFRSDSEFNAAGYTNPEIDALLEEAAVELDPAKRVAMYTEIERLLLEDYASIPLLTSVIDTLAKPRIGGFFEAAMGVRTVPLMNLNPTSEP